MFRKYKWNFVAGVFLASLIGFIIFDIILFFSIRRYLFHQTFHEMQIKTRLAVKMLEQQDLSGLKDDLPDLIAYTYQVRDILNSRVTIIDSTGRVLTDSDVPLDSISNMDNHLHRAEMQGAIKNGWGQNYRRSETVNIKLFYTAFPIHNMGETVGFLRLAYYTRNFDKSMNKIITLIIVSNLIGITTLFGVAFFSGTVVTFPILRIVRTAKRISEGDLERTFQERRKDEIGTLARILNQLTDRLKSQISQISNERTKLEHILTNLDIGIIAIDQNKKILHANPIIYEILADKTDKITDEEIYKILSIQPLAESIEQTLETGNKQSSELVYITEDEKTYFRYMATPFYMTDHHESGALIQFQDVTELKTLEAIRRDFVGNASHELKTPLSAIIGYAETLLEGAAEKPTARMKFIRKIREQGQRLEFLVTDLLKLSELERELPLAKSNFSMSQMIAEVRDEFIEKSKQKNISLHTEVEDDLHINADAEGIRTVFNNLIDNAIKYTPENGKVTIQITAVNIKRLKIVIEDTGIGIDPKYHDRIFQRFYRVDKARSRAMGGTGLGLAIVKHIIERHGSTIHLHSKPGKGSIFWFMLERI